MIGRRICHKQVWTSGPRLLCHFTSQTSPLSPPPASASQGKHPFLDSSISSFFRNVSTSFSPINLNLENKVNRCWFSSFVAAEVQTNGLVDVPLAQTGEGIAECELIKWFVQEGDEVEEFQPLCEVQSDKATIEITSRYKGKIAKVLYFPGDIVKVGETLVKMLVEGSHAPSQELDGSQVPVGADDILDCTKSLLSELSKSKTVGVLSTPAVRQLAKDYGININDVHGTGKDGRILKEDVVKYAIRKGIIKDEPETGEQFFGGEDYVHASSQVGQRFDDKIVPLRGFQRASVKTMALAAKVPHFHYVEEINCNALVELKETFQNSNTDPSVKHTFLPTLIKLLSVALTKFPWVNSCFNEESMEVILKGSHNIGIAMATPNGLVVPNIKNVQSLSILEVTKELSRLQQLALDNKLSPEDITGGTITLSNIGAIGGKFGVPIVNLPEVAIIAIGRIQKIPRFADDGELEAVPTVTVDIGADHRVLDGAIVAKFCNEWKRLIENPELLMLLMR